MAIVHLGKPSATSFSSVYTAELSQEYFLKEGDVEENIEKNGNNVFQILYQAYDNLSLLPYLGRGEYCIKIKGLAPL